jgi:hypothetical protein
VCEDLPTEGVHGEDSVFEESVCEEVEEDPKKSKEAKVPVEVKSSVEKDQDEEEPSLAVASCNKQLGEHKRGEGKLEDVASRDLKVAVVRLKDGDRRGLWGGEVHELPKSQSIQAIAHDAASDVELPLLLDIETNISTLHTNLARRLSVDVRMFADPPGFYSLLQDPVGAHGPVKMEDQLRQCVAFEMDVWIADVDAQSIAILDTDLMVRCGILQDAKTVCARGRRESRCRCSHIKTWRC